MNGMVPVVRRGQWTMAPSGQVYAPKGGPYAQGIPQFYRPTPVYVPAGPYAQPRIEYRAVGTDVVDLSRFSQEELRMVARGTASPEMFMRAGGINCANYIVLYDQSRDGSAQWLERTMRQAQAVLRHYFYLDRQSSLMIADAIYNHCTQQTSLAPGVAPQPFRYTESDIAPSTKPSGILPEGTQPMTALLIGAAIGAVATWMLKP